VRIDQHSLLDASLNTLPAVKDAMRMVAAGSRLSREQIADAMNDLAERNGIRLGGNGGIKKDTLEKWLNPLEREHAPSLLGLVVFCRVMGSMEPFQAMLAPLGLTVIDESDAALLRMATIEREIEQLQRERRKLKERI
jgi:hypothetical protein